MSKPSLLQTYRTLFHDMPFYPLRLQPTKNAALRRTGRAVTRQETTPFPNPSPNSIGRVLRLGPCCSENRLYFHESSAHTSVSKFSEPLGFVAGPRRQVLHIRAHSAQARCTVVTAVAGRRTISAGFDALERAEGSADSCSFIVTSWCGFACR